jgi:hypothetical protein
MGERPVVEDTRVVEKSDEIRYAQGAVATLEDAKEIKDESRDDKYWEAFREAEERLETEYDAELDAEEDVTSTDEEIDDHAPVAGQEQVEND